MGEIAVRIAVHAYALDSHSLEKPRHYYSADGVDSIQNHLEAGGPDCLHIDVFQFQHLVQMPVGKVFLRDGSDGIDVCKLEVPGLGAVQNCLTLSGIEELSLLIEKLQGVPLPRVV